MQYRDFGKDNVSLSALGFGCMRLPVIDGDTGKIDEAEAIRMIRHAIDNGVNYIDTAWPYHNETSENLVGKALEDGYREKVYLATKSPVYYVKEPSDFDKYLDLQLEKLGTDRIDFYLLHALTGKRWQECKDNDVFAFIDRARAAGKIKYIGFSFHDQLPAFKEIADAYAWDFCQIQLNYMNENYQAGLEGLHYAAAKGLPVVIMEPLLGGRLAKSGTGALAEIWNSAPVKRTPVDWALRWLWNKPEVTVILSGMSTMEHVEENMQIAQDAMPNTLTAAELAVIDKAKQYYLARTKVDCTACGYCADCPGKVRISTIFELYNDAFMYDEHDSARRWYKQMADNSRDFSACIDCGKCEEVCPQHLEIRKHIKVFHEAYGQ